MITSISNVKTTLVSSDDEKHTYSITKTFTNIKDGEKAVFVLLYPTRSKENINCDDLTICHIVSHMKELNFSEITIINLFSKVVKSKLSAKGLTVDEKNIQYIENEIIKRKISIIKNSYLPTETACKLVQHVLKAKKLFKIYSINIILMDISINLQQNQCLTKYFPIHYG